MDLVVIGSTSGASALTLNSGTGNINVTPNGASNSGVIVKPYTAATALFTVQSAADATLFNANTSSLTITIAGTTTTFASLTLTDAHIKSTQTTAPTIGTPASCGTGPTAAVTASSTDAAGSITINVGSGAPTICTTVVTFQYAYNAAPKSVILTPNLTVGSATAPIAAVISAIGTGSFTVKIAPTNAAASAKYSYYYWVVE